MNNNKKLGFGCMRLPVNGNLKRTINSKVNVDEFKKMVDLFMSRGFNYFDTAYIYHLGKSEEALNEALVKRYSRDSFTITDKLPMFMIFTKAQMEKIFNEQLKRLGVDYIDYYWLHALNHGEFNKAKKLEAYNFIIQKKKEGKIKHIGFSFHDTTDVLEKIIKEFPEMEYVQLQINYLDWEDKKVQSRKCYEICEKYNKKVIVMEPVKGGTLANVPKEAEKILKTAEPEMSIASWAIRYVASLENVVMVLSGMSNMEQTDDNTNYMMDFKPLTDKERKLISVVTNIIKGKKQIQCTACRYCQEGCPANIAIPEYFSLCNRKDEIENLQEEYEKIIKDGAGKASDCIKCGKCEEACPQHLPIRNLLENIEGIVYYK